MVSSPKLMYYRNAVLAMLGNLVWLSEPGIFAFVGIGLCNMVVGASIVYALLSPAQIVELPLERELNLKSKRIGVLHAGHVSQNQEQLRIIIVRFQIDVLKVEVSSNDDARTLADLLSKSEGIEKLHTTFTSREYKSLLRTLVETDVVDCCTDNLVVDIALPDERN